MVEPVGYVYGYDEQRVRVLVTRDEYLPGIGDLLYVKVNDKYVLLQVVGYEGEVPAPPSSFVREPQSRPPLYSVAKSTYAKAVPFFEVKVSKVGGEVLPIVVKPSQPPPLDSSAYLVVKGDYESDKIMEYLSRGTKPIRASSAPVPIAWLRSGVAPVEFMRSEKYFERAQLRMDLRDAIPKHVLVAGQTGSGKTTSVMGLIVQWSWRGEPGISWLVIDRHGEYSEWRPGGFLDALNKAIYINERLSSGHAKRSLVHVYVFQYAREGSWQPSPYVSHLTGSIDISSINLYDLANAMELSDERVNELEEIVDTVASRLKAARESGQVDGQWIDVFLRSGEASGNAIALIPLLVDNMVKHEGVGERDKRGLYALLLRAGIDVRKLRSYRRLVLTAFGHRVVRKLVKTPSVSVEVSVLDDSSSVFKVSPLLKNEHALVKLMSALASAIERAESATMAALYPWRRAKVEGPVGVDRLLGGSISVDEIVERLDSGGVVILDVSKISISQGDIVMLSVLRRLFEHRMAIGVEASRERARVSVVSEEAPLYLSRERVQSPFNVFARIAREGRKFGIGLIAITQLATEIDRQILTNFNTIVVLRTKYLSDINYFKDIGVPGETLPSLGDREGYLYTPDLSVKEPIPVYLPAHFDYLDSINDEYSRALRRAREVEDASRALSSIISESEG